MGVSGLSSANINGSQPFRVNNLVINNPAGIILNNTLAVTPGICTFQRGIVTAPNAGQPFLLGLNSGVTGASDSSHINGYVDCKTQGAMVLPTGDSVRYRKIGVNFPSAGEIKIHYVGAYAGAAPFGTTGAAATPLQAVNHSGYWDVVPVSSVTSAAVTLYWDKNTPPGLKGYTNFKVAQLTGGSWLNEGGSAQGNDTTGRITSSQVTLANEGFFTIGSTDTLTCTPTASSTAVIVCQAALPYVWNGGSYNAAGNYTVHLTNAHGCDSAATLQLAVDTLKATFTPVTTTMACYGKFVYAVARGTAGRRPTASALTAGWVCGCHRTIFTTLPLARIPKPLPIRWVAM